MTKKRLIMVSIIAICIISNSLFTYVNAEHANNIGVNDVFENSKVIQQKGNVKNTIRPATKEEIIEDFIQKNYYHMKKQRNYTKKKEK